MLYNLNKRWQSTHSLQSGDRFVSGLGFESRDMSMRTHWPGGQSVRNLYSITTRSVFRADVDI